MTSYMVHWMFNHAINLSLRFNICVNERYNLPCSIDSILNTLVWRTNYENKIIFCIQNVTWKYCRKRFRFLGWLNGWYYHKSWYFRPKNRPRFNGQVLRYVSDHYDSKLIITNLEVMSKLMKWYEWLKHD